MSRDLVARYFAMWNARDSSAASEILDPGWVDHGHPEVVSVEDVQRAVESIPAGLVFRVDAILEGTGTVPEKGTLFAVVGGVGASNLIWLIRSHEGLLAEMWTYRTDS